MDTDTYTDRIRQFCTAFKLPTVGTEAVPRFQQAGHGEALETLLEVLELEAEDRQQRRTTRLRRASRLAPGKTWDTFSSAGNNRRYDKEVGLTWLDPGMGNKKAPSTEETTDIRIRRAKKERHQNLSDNAALF